MNNDIYLMDCNYEFGGMRGHMTGKLSVNSEGFFKNIVRDWNAAEPERIIYGRIKNIGDITDFSFFKFHPVRQVSNILYSVQKPKANDFSGIYCGTWNTVENKKRLDEDKESLEATLANVKLSKEDHVEITLSYQLK